MGLFSRLRRMPSGNFQVAIDPPNGIDTAPVPVVALSDGNGNVAKGYDNADGTYTPAARLDDVAVPIEGLAASATGGAGAEVLATLAAVAGKTNYITGLTVTARAPAATVGAVVTVAGVAGGTLSFQFVESASAGGKLEIVFATPVPASAVNTAIVVTLPAVTTGGAGAVVVTGFRK